MIGALYNATTDIMNQHTYSDIGVLFTQYVAREKNADPFVMKVKSNIHVYLQWLRKTRAILLIALRRKEMRKIFDSRLESLLAKQKTRRRRKTDGITFK